MCLKVEAFLNTLNVMQDASEASDTSVSKFYSIFADITLLRNTLNTKKDLLNEFKPVSLKWNSDDIFTVLLQDGTILHVTIKNLLTGDCIFHVERFAGVNDILSDAVYSDKNIVFLFPDNRIVIARTSVVESSDIDDEDDDSDDEAELSVSLQAYQNFLPGLASKRIERKLSLHESAEIFIIWWSITEEEFYPWSPRPEQRANVLVYNFEADPELIFFTKTENKLLCTYFVPKSDLILTLEEAISSVGKVELTETLYNLTSGSKTGETVLPLQSHVTCHAYDTKKRKLAIGESDSTIVISFQAGKINRSNKTLFIPRNLEWHPDSVLIFVSGDQGQFQIFDIALVPMLLLYHTQVSPSLTQQLEPHGPLTRSCWSAQTGQIVMRSETGSLSILRLGITKMTLLNLVQYYVGNDQIHEGLNVLRSVEWNSEECLHAVYHIFGVLITRENCEKTEYYLDQLLSTYFTPPVVPNDDIWQSHRSSVKLMARKYFMRLIIAERLEKALELALKLDESVFFYKVRNRAVLRGNYALASEAMKYVGDGSGDSDNTDSHLSSSSTHPTSCSTCTGSSSDYSENENESLVPTAKNLEFRETVKPHRETLKTLQIAKPHGSTKSLETAKLRDSTKPLETVELHESTKSLETMKFRESTKPFGPVKLRENTKSLETVKSLETAKPLETVELRENTKPFEAVKLHESTKSLETVKLRESTKSLETVKLRDSTKSFETAKSLETAKPHEAEVKLREMAKPVLPSSDSETPPPAEPNFTLARDSSLILAEDSKITVIQLGHV